MKWKYPYGTLMCTAASAYLWYLVGHLNLHGIRFLLLLASATIQPAMVAWSAIEIWTAYKKANEIAIKYLNLYRETLEGE